MFLHSQPKASLYQVSCQWRLPSKDFSWSAKQNLVNKYIDKVKQLKRKAKIKNQYLENNLSIIWCDDSNVKNSRHYKYNKTIKKENKDSIIKFPTYIEEVETKQREQKNKKNIQELLCK